MVLIDAVRACNSKLVTQPFVGVFVGGTAGIGEASVRALAETYADHGKSLRVYIVGRNKAAAEKIVSECLEVCPAGDFRFVQAIDLALIKEVDRVCSEITKAERETAGEKAKVDLLVTTQGYLSFESRRGMPWKTCIC
jgi:NAD(P)-dependent dehydrogenase (short-subunit alcohol dehydrogenase family)